MVIINNNNKVVVIVPGYFVVSPLISLNVSNYIKNVIKSLNCFNFKIKTIHHHLSM